MIMRSRCKNIMNAKRVSIVSEYSIEHPHADGRYIVYIIDAGDYNPTEYLTSVEFEGLILIGFMIDALLSNGWSMQGSYQIYSDNSRHFPLIEIERVE